MAQEKLFRERSNGKYKKYSDIHIRYLDSSEHESNYDLTYRGYAENPLDAILFVYRSFIQKSHFIKIYDFKNKHDSKTAEIEAEGGLSFHNWYLKGKAIKNENEEYSVIIEVHEFKRGY